MTRNVYATYAARGERRRRKLVPCLSLRRRMGLDREQYRIYSGRGGRRADRLTRRACVSGAASLIGMICLLAGKNGLPTLAVTAAATLFCVTCAVRARRAQIAHDVRCGFYF